MRRILLIALLIAVTAAAHTEEPKRATWNLEWLTDRPDGDPSLPKNAHPKRPDDIATLATYAAQLNADLIAIQEVDGRTIAARIFPPDHYSIHMTHDHVGAACRPRGAEGTPVRCESGPNLADRFGSRR
jgi:hypothetical protein